MSPQEVRSPDRPGGSRRERAGVLALAGLIVGGIGFYLALRASDDNRNTQKDLLPYQVLARTLPDAEQNIFRTLRQGLLEAEAERSRSSAWPEPSILAERGIAPFTESEGAGFRWQRFQAGARVNYLGLPPDPSSPAWLLAVQEPEPNTPPDPAPLDDEHHKLPDGTTLHIYVWTHRYGGRVTPHFVPQPQGEGWTQVFSAPPNPLFLPKQ
jgi:hypothetical protein